MVFRGHSTAANRSRLRCHNLSHVHAEGSEQAHGCLLAARLLGNRDHRGGLGSPLRAQPAEGNGGWRHKSGTPAILSGRIMVGARTGRSSFRRQSATETIWAPEGYTPKKIGVWLIMSRT